MTVDEPAVAPRRRSTLLLVAAVALVALCWIVGNPRSAGPDEPSHMVAGAGFVRFQGSGDVSPDNPALHLLEVPQMVGAPDPGCWAFVPDETPACADDVELTDDMVDAATTTYNYPPWGLVLPGLASFVPWADGYAYLARALSSLVPVLLVGFSLSALAAVGRIHAAAAFLGITPIVWFTFGTVNPSSLAIGGGLALWTGLMLLGRPHADVLALAGWAAVLLPRRDGPVWATLVVIAVCILVRTRPTELWRRMRPVPRWLVIAAAPLALIPPLWRGDLGFNLLLAMAPLALVAVEVFAVAWDRSPDRAGRAWLAAIVAGVVVVGAAFVVLQRPGGYDAEVVRLVVANTGDHLTQLVGLLGWLNAPVPTSAVLLYWATLGALVGVALLDRSRSAATVGAMVMAAVVTAWLLELGQGSNYGDYWQGRYTMPFAVGLPLVATWGVRDRRIDDLAVPVAAASWIIVNFGFFAAQRRWAVGNDGTWYVWRWGTWDAPLHPMLLLVLHAAATAWLAFVLVQRRAEVNRT